MKLLTSAIQDLTQVIKEMKQAPDMPIAVSQEPSAGDLLEQYSQMKAYELNVGIGLGTETSQTSQASIPIEIGTKTTLSPKLDFAIEWLKRNPQDKAKSGRELEVSVSMNGESISYKWWNKAKNKE